MWDVEADVDVDVEVEVDVDADVDVDGVLVSIDAEGGADTHSNVELDW